MVSLVVHVGVSYLALSNGVGALRHISERYALVPRQSMLSVYFLSAITQFTIDLNAVILQSMGTSVKAR